MVNCLKAHDAVDARNPSVELKLITKTTTANVGEIKQNAPPKHLCVLLEELKSEPKKKRTSFVASEEIYFA